MRVVKCPDFKTYQWNIDSIDKEYRAGLITREEAYRQKKNITEAYRNGDVKRRIDEAFNAQKNINFVIEK